MRISVLSLSLVHPRLSCFNKSLQHFTIGFALTFYGFVGGSRVTAVFNKPVLSSKEYRYFLLFCQPEFIECHINRQAIVCIKMAYLRAELLQGAIISCNRLK